jgi:hypothetical protein
MLIVSENSEEYFLACDARHQRDDNRKKQKLSLDLSLNLPQRYVVRLRRSGYRHVTRV